MHGSAIRRAPSRTERARATASSVATALEPRLRPAGEIAYASASRFSELTPRATSSASLDWMLKSAALVLRVAHFASAEQMPQSAS